MLTIISKIDSTSGWDGKDGKYTINFDEVLDFIDSKHESKRQQMMLATDNLLSKVVHIRLKDMDNDLVEKYKKVKLDEGERPLDFDRDEIQTNWVLPPIRYTMGHDDLPIKIDKFLMPFLIEIKKNFTQISLEEAVRLRSKYGFRLFEIILSYAHRRKAEVLYEDLRNMLGIEDKLYQRFTNFRKRVLDVAVRDIEENTTLRFSVNINKKRGKVHSITFDKIKKVKEKKQYEIPRDIFDNMPDDQKRSEVKNRLKNKEEYTEPMKDWERELQRKGVVLHDKLRKELDQEHWEEALKIEGLEGNKIVIEARKVRDKKIFEIDEEKRRIEESNQIKKNKKWFEQNRMNYEGLSESDAYLQTAKGKVIRWNSKTIEKDIEKHRKPQDQIDEERRKVNRRSAGLKITGTGGDQRKGDRRT